jgi:hypothetical protein
VHGSFGAGSVGQTAVGGGQDAFMPLQAPDVHVHTSRQFAATESP